MVGCLRVGSWQINGETKTWERNKWRIVLRLLVDVSRVGSWKINGETKTWERKTGRIVLRLFIGKHRWFTAR